MKTEIVDSNKGALSRCFLEEAERIVHVAAFLEVMANCPTHTIILRKGDFAEDFFDLKTGLAGECLQKVSNYKRRLIILGDYREIKSKAFRDFKNESNGTGQVLFTDDLPTAIELLK